MALPYYIDNQNHTLAAILEQLINNENELTLDIATGYFRIEAWLQLEQAMNKLQSFRLLIGRDPTIRPAETDRIDLIRYFRRDISNNLEGSLYRLEYKNQIDRLIAYLQQEHVQVRLYGVNGEKSQFLHAKAYIFDHYSIVGSSNFTPAGLRANSELSMINSIEPVAKDLRENWFERFWNDESVDRDYKQKLIDVLNASKFGSKAYTPYQIFLKSIYELFKEDTVVGDGDRSTLELASFQQEGFERAIRLIEKHRGCMVADAVGLGKTFIGLRVLEYYLIRERKSRNVPRALVVCPAQLRDLVWNKKLDEFGIKADVVSQEEIGRKDFDIKKYDQYDLIVVDESHNFRNSASNRFYNLSKLISSGKRNKRILLLTATPINNTIFDLYHQMLLLARNSKTYYREYGISNLADYFKRLNNCEVEITELLMQTMVRRSRQDVIKRQRAGEEIRINGEAIKFPQRQLENFTYNFEDSFNGLYAGIAEQIGGLHLAPYNIKAFLKSKGAADEGEISRNEALVALQKALYLKRLESSLTAVCKSIANQRNFQYHFLNTLINEDKLLDSKSFRKWILKGQIEDSEESYGDLFDSLVAINPKSYKIDQLKRCIEDDLKTLNDITAKLNLIQEGVGGEQSGERQGRASGDRKLTAFKELLVGRLRGEKILVFSYFKDTAEYLYKSLIADSDWMEEMDNPEIEIITGAVPEKRRQKLVGRFAPKANSFLFGDGGEDEEEGTIDILICTDVLSEGQNLQDAPVLINYDLHWNPVRMIQRAGRIDRLGTDHETLTIYNCFPEEGLENLLGLVKRLQERIATIDREVGLDASVLGEVISGRSLDELIALKKADTDAEKQAILEELESIGELVSLDEMRLPLLEFIQNRTREEIEDIPKGIHSTRHYNIPDSRYPEGGLFMALKAADIHFWRFYKRVDGQIITDREFMETDKRKLFNWLKCKESDYDAPETLRPVSFDKSIFRVLEAAIDDIHEGFQRKTAAAQLKPSMSPVLTNIFGALIDAKKQRKLDPDLLPAIDRLCSVINSLNLKSFDKEIKRIWGVYREMKNIENMIRDLDDLFTETEQYDNVDGGEEEDDRLKIVAREEIELICYEWFYPDIKP